VTPRYEPPQTYVQCMNKVVTTVATTLATSIAVAKKARNLRLPSVMPRMKLLPRNVLLRCLSCSSAECADARLYA